MTEDTVLDAAHAEMMRAPEDDAARMAFYAALAGTELTVMLAEEARGDRIQPQIFETAEGAFVLAFDSEMRLAEFSGRAVPYVSLPGRALAEMMIGQDVGLALNPEVAPSSILLPATAMAWLAETVSQTPDQIEERIVQLQPPSGLPDAFLVALDTRLARAAGLAKNAYLVGARYSNGVCGHLLGVIDVAPDAEDVLARVIGEALTFSGIEAGSLDITFFASSDPLAADLAKVGLRFDLPDPGAATGEPAAPGSDPDRPPILR